MSHEIAVHAPSSEPCGPTGPLGRCVGVGVGPGDPELITVKALRTLQSAPAVAYFAATNRPSNARAVVSTYLRDSQIEMRLEYPVTTEALPDGVSYETLLADFYDDSAKAIAEVLDAGKDVAVLCEGDPFFYGSFMYIHNRLRERYTVDVIPGVPSILAGAAVLGTPLVCLNEVLTVLSGVLPADELATRLREADAAVVMKLGRNLAKVREAVTVAGLLDRAFYVERATLATQRVLRLADIDPSTSPYFSMVVIPSAVASAR